MMVSLEYHNYVSTKVIILPTNSKVSQWQTSHDFLAKTAMKKWDLKVLNHLFFRSVPHAAFNEYLLLNGTDASKTCFESCC